jgi:hypothetical protein
MEPDPIHSQLSGVSMHVATTRPIQLLQAIMPPLGSPMENPKNPCHTDWDHNNDNSNLNLVGVTIHNLSQGGTILEQSDHSDESNRCHDTGTAELIGAAASLLSLYNRYRPHGVDCADVDDDDIISHTRSCYLSANGHEGNGYITPERSPRDCFKFDCAAPYETNQ